MLFKHAVHATCWKFRQQRIGGIKSVTQEDVAYFKGIKHGSQERLFATAFAFEFPHGRIQCGATGQTGDADNATDRKAQSGLLAALLRIGRLVGRCIW